MLDKNKSDKNVQFLLGRNILQILDGGERTTIAYFRNPGDKLASWTIKGENHILNGILFEIYFDSNGRFRQGMNFKSAYINEICKLEEDKRFESSFELIYNQLLPFRSFLLYIPSNKPMNLPIELQFERKIIKEFDVESTVFELKSVLYQGTNLLQIDEEDTHYSKCYYDELKDELSRKLCVPKTRLTLSTNYNVDNEVIRKPHYYKIGPK